MEFEQKMNILVLGPSGAGKSTLIKAISGKPVHVGVGEGQTQNIEVFESDIWPLKLIDTKGFEYNVFERLKTINQIKKFTKTNIKTKDDSTGIDAIWYCIDGMSGRVFFDNIKTMNNSVKEWKNVPIFVVITKSIVSGNISENVKAVQDAFDKSKNSNLKDIIPVVAEEYVIDEDSVVSPFGIEKLCQNAENLNANAIVKLCQKTIDSYGEAKEISGSNIQTMILKQKRFTSQSIISISTAAGFGVGALPIPSSPILMPIEVAMVNAVLKTYDVKIEKSAIPSLISTGAVTTVGKSLAEVATKWIPGVSIVYGVVAAVIIAALGEATAITGEKIYRGQLDSDNVNKIFDDIRKQIKDNPLIEATKTYLVENKDNIKGKSAKEIYESVVEESKKKNTK